MYVDFYSFLFGHLKAGPMALPTDDKLQRHPFLCQYVKVDTEVKPQYQIISLILIFCHDVLCTHVLGGVCSIAKMLVIRGAF